MWLLLCSLDKFGIFSWLIHLYIGIHLLIMNLKEKQNEHM